jgi:hypothetical protein
MYGLRHLFLYLPGAGRYYGSEKEEGRQIRCIGRAAEVLLPGSPGTFITFFPQAGFLNAACGPL